MEEKRVTDFGEVEIPGIAGKSFKVRPLTFKEKRKYLELAKEITSSAEKSTETEDPAVILDAGVKTLLFIINILNPEITAADVEENINGSVQKKIFAIAFFDPLG